jgi:hypothetical protein
MSNNENITEKGCECLSKEQITHHIELEEVRPKCHTCKFWAYRLPNVGECRAEAPQGKGPNSAQFPVMHFLGWCGKHESII